MELLSCLHFYLLLISFFHVGNAMIHGKPAGKGNFPYMAYTIMKSDSLWCSGAILDETHIITAAHCVADVHTHDLEVIVGKVTLNFHSDHKWKVDKKIVYPKFIHSKKVEFLPFLILCTRTLGRPDKELLAHNDIAILKGDSGSPLVHSNYLLGIAINSHCDPHIPSLFVKLAAYEQFIKETLSKN